jgi:Zn-dependent protease with chaperone function
MAGCGVVRHWGMGLMVAATLAGCTLPAPGLQVLPGPEFAPPQPRDAARTFVEVVERVEPVAEAICRERTRGIPCRFSIAIDDRPGQAPNAFQTVDEAGNPVIAFNLALIAYVRNPDELAFVMGHEASHHIAGHIARQQEFSMAGALVAGTLASLGGADAAAVKAAQDTGAQVGARTFSKDFELEADALGTEIAYRAGFDPVLGAQFFTRLPDPGNRFLGTHPPNAQRLATVQRTMETLR